MDNQEKIIQLQGLQLVIDGAIYNVTQATSDTEANNIIDGVKSELQKKLDTANSQVQELLRSERADMKSKIELIKHEYNSSAPSPKIIEALILSGQAIYTCNYDGDLAYYTPFHYSPHWILDPHENVKYKILTAFSRKLNKCNLFLLITQHNNVFVFDCNGKRFYHYHSIDDSDCTGTYRYTGDPVKDLKQLTVVFDMINIGSLGSERRDVPSLDGGGTYIQTFADLGAIDISKPIPVKQWTT